MALRLRCPDIEADIGMSRKSITFMIPVAAAVLGSCIGLWLAAQINAGVFTHWKLLGAPRERVSRLVRAIPFTVYVQTAQGTIFSCDSSRQTVYWRTDNLPQDVRLPPTCDLGYSPDLPCKATDSLELSICGEEAIRAKYVLCEDGNVWAWQNTINPIMIPIDYSRIACPFSIAGFLVGLVPVIIWRKRRGNTPST